MSFNWPQFLTDSGIHFTDSGSNISSGYIAIETCPFCGKGGYKAAFGLEFGNQNCWSCGKHSRLDTIIALLNCTKEQGLQLYHKYKGNSDYVPRDTSSTSLVQKVDLPGSTFTKPELKYMDSRGITKCHIDKYDIRSGGLTHPIFSYRIIFPVFSGGRIVSAHARSIIKGIEPKYKALPANMEIKPHKHCLFGQQFAKGSRACLLEGDIDVILGGDGFISSFGTTFTDKQVALLSQYDTVFTAFDMDGPGREANEKISNVLSVIGTEVVAISWDSCYKDIGAMPESERTYLKKELGV